MMPASSRSRPWSSQRGGIFFRLLFLIFFLFLIFLVYLARHPLLRMAGSFWIVDEGPVASDAIVILGDDNYNGDRATRAAERSEGRMGSANRCERPGASLLRQHRRTRGARSDRSRRSHHRNRSFRPSRGKHQGRSRGNRAAHFLAWMEADNCRHIKFPHASRAIYLRKNVPARHRASRRGRAG